MKKVKLLVDSTCDLPLNLLKANDVDIIPLMVNFNEEGYEDLVELSTADLYRKVEEKGILPKTAARSIEKFKEVYQKFFDQGYEEIVFIGISGYFSSTIQNALTAGNKFPGRVFVHDSLNLSSGEGLQILKAIEILKSDWGNVDLGTVMITHSMADSSAEYLHRKLKEFVPEDKIMITDAGCVISSHCGKGTIGILYILKP